MTTNSLSRPLNYFHANFVSIFDALPKNEKAFEITKRVIIAVASIFAYPVFGCLYLIGKFYDSFLKNERDVKQKSCIDISEKMKELKNSIILDITETITVNTIQSTKIFFNLSVDENSVHKDFIITKKDKSVFDNEFLTQSIESIINELGELMSKSGEKKFYFEWDALIKDTNSIFARVHGAAGSTSSVAGNFGNISLNDGAEKIFNLVLKKMGREVKPQLDDHHEFVL